MKVYGSLLCFLLALSTTAFAQIELVFTGKWGTNPDEIGIRLIESAILPPAPFNGPGGFYVDSDGIVWISDSIQGSVKGFPLSEKDSKPIKIFPVKQKKLGDIFVNKDFIFVCTADPKGILKLDKKDGKELTHISVPFGNPGKLLVVDDKTMAVEDHRGGIWTIIDEKVTKHPAEALEAVGNKKWLYGVLFDLDPQSRKIIKAGWSGEATEPELFALFQSTKGNILSSQIIGLIDDLPVFKCLCASEPQTLTFSYFNETGNIKWTKTADLLDSCFLASQWILGADNHLYGFSADLNNFKIRRIKLNDTK